MENQVDLRIIWILPGEGGKEGGFAGVWQADDTYVCHDAQLQRQRELLPGLPLGVRPVVDVLQHDLLNAGSLQQQDPKVKTPIMTVILLGRMAQ